MIISEIFNQNLIPFNPLNLSLHNVNYEVICVKKIA